MFFRTSFVRKVVALSLVSTLVAVWSALAIFQWQNWTVEQDDLVADQMEVAEKLAAIFEGAPAAAALKAQAIIDADEHGEGAIYFSRTGATAAFWDDDFDPRATAPLGVATATAVTHISGVDLHVPVVVNGQRVGELVLLASNWEVRQSLARNLKAAIVLSLCATLLAGLLSAALVHGTLRPLQSLNRAIENVRRTRNFGVQVEITTEDEIGRLTENFNAMLADLEDYSRTLHEALGEVTASRDAAEQATLQKSQFVANMSHEIRTPLNGILGMAQVMAAAPLEPAQREQVEVIRRSGATLLTVLNDILDFSKIEAGRLELESAPFDIEEVAGDACSTFRLAAAAKDIGFEFEIADSARGAWRGDAVRLRQLLYNLISNAIKFTQNGEVRVRIDQILRDGREALFLSVADTGIGVAPEHLPRLFDEFTQADASTSRRFGGTGLGLTICRHIAELMGGEIRARSELGEGTVFEVELPLERLAGRAAPTAAAPRHTEADLSGLRVLAAEDNETNQLVLRAILESFGIDPVIVGDGRQAVEARRTDTFDLILMDMQMPVMDGVAATRAIRKWEAAHGAARATIVALSANAMSPQVSEYLACGMDNHVAKPIEIDKLHAVLVEAMDGEPALRALAT